jgi:hypothetical protein
MKRWHDGWLNRLPTRRPVRARPSRRQSQRASHCMQSDVQARTHSLAGQRDHCKRVVVTMIHFTISLCYFRRGSYRGGLRPLTGKDTQCITNRNCPETKGCQLTPARQLIIGMKLVAEGRRLAGQWPAVADVREATASAFAASIGCCRGFSG